MIKANIFRKVSLLTAVMLETYYSNYNEFKIWNNFVFYWNKSTFNNILIYWDVPAKCEKKRNNRHAFFDSQPCYLLDPLGSTSRKRCEVGGHSVTRCVRAGMEVRDQKGYECEKLLGCLSCWDRRDLKRST